MQKCIKLDPKVKKQQHFFLVILRLYIALGSCFSPSPYFILSIIPINQVHLGFICPKNLSQSCGGSFRCLTLSVTTGLHLVVNHLYSIYIHEGIAWYTYHMKDVDCIGVVWPSFLFGRHGVASTPSHCVLSTLPCVCVQSWKWGKQPQNPSTEQIRHQWQQIGHLLSQTWLKKIEWKWVAKWLVDVLTLWAV